MKNKTFLSLISIFGNGRNKGLHYQIPLSINEFNKIKHTIIPYKGDENWLAMSYEINEIMAIEISLLLELNFKFDFKKYFYSIDSLVSDEFLLTYEG